MNQSHVCRLFVSILNFVWRLHFTLMTYFDDQHFTVFTPYKARSFLSLFDSNILVDTVCLIEWRNIVLLGVVLKVFAFLFRICPTHAHTTFYHYAIRNKRNSMDVFEIWVRWSPISDWMYVKYILAVNFAKWLSWTFCEEYIYIVNVRVFRYGFARLDDWFVCRSDVLAQVLCFALYSHCTFLCATCDLLIYHIRRS